MTPMFWIDLVLELFFIAAVAGIPMWLIIKRPDRAADHSGAHAYLRVKEDFEHGTGDSAAHLAAMAAAAAPPATRRGRWKLGPPRGTRPGRRPAVAPQHDWADDTAGLVGRRDA